MTDQTPIPPAASKPVDPFSGETIRRALDELARVLDAPPSDPSDAAMVHAKLDELKHAFDTFSGPALLKVARNLDVARALALLPDVSKLAEPEPGTALRVQPLGRMRNGDALPETVATRLADGVDSGEQDPRRRWAIALPNTQLVSWHQLCAGADVLDELRERPRTPISAFVQQMSTIPAPGWGDRPRPHDELEAGPGVDVSPRRPAGPLDEEAEAAAGDLTTDDDAPEDPWIPPMTSASSGGVFKEPGDDSEGRADDVDTRGF